MIFICGTCFSIDKSRFFLCFFDRMPPFLTAFVSYNFGYEKSIGNSATQIFS